MKRCSAKQTVSLAAAYISIEMHKTFVIKSINMYVINPQLMVNDLPLARWNFTAAAWHSIWAKRAFSCESWNGRAFSMQLPNFLDSNLSRRVDSLSRMRNVELASCMRTK